MLKTENIEFNIDFRKIASGAQMLLDIISGEESFDDRAYLQYSAQLNFLYCVDVIDFGTYSEFHEILQGKRRWE